MKLALSPAEACESLGVSRSFFDNKIKPNLKAVYVGKRVIIPVTSLEEWIRANSHSAL